MSRPLSPSALLLQLQLMMLCSALFAAAAVDSQPAAEQHCSPQICLRASRLAAASVRCRRFCVDLTLQQAASLLELEATADEAATTDLDEDKRASFIRMGKKASFIRMGKKRASFIRMGKREGELEKSKKATFIRMG